MHTSIELLDAVRRRHGLPSDYSASKLIGVSRASISKVRGSKAHFGPENALKIADLLSIDAGYVLACVEAERSQSATVRAAWEGLAAQVAKGSGAALLAVGLALPGIAQASELLCYVKRTLRRSAATSFA